jgi:hypothetical protein
MVSPEESGRAEGLTMGIEGTLRRRSGPRIRLMTVVGHGERWIVGEFGTES